MRSPVLDREKDQELRIGIFQYSKVRKKEGMGTGAWEGAAREAGGKPRVCVVGWNQFKT